MAARGEPRSPLTHLHPHPTLSLAGRGECWGRKGKAMILIPEPQELLLQPGYAGLGEPGRPRCRVVAQDAAPLVREAAALIARGIGRRLGRAPEVTEKADPRPEMVDIVLSVASGAIEAERNAEQAYALQVERGRVTLVGNTPAGCWYAAQTFLQAIATREGALVCPRLSVRDWPALAHRGIYVECRWPPELMTLDDWKEAIDYLAALKLNVMSVGLYNNWPIQYDGKKSQFMMAPISKYPKLRAPKWIHYYSPTEMEEKCLEYLPRMFEQDFFGEVVAYGRRRNVTVRPHFNTPGHNTLIPSAYPEVSAKDAEGNPKGYGFCLSNPKTYEMMFDIFDEIIEKYLRPNGVDWFHIASDEVYPVRGVDEGDPHRLVSPWCECAQCREVAHDEQYVSYVIRLAQHLKSRGITTIGMWHDSLVAGGRLNEGLLRRLEEAGIKDLVVLHWWTYYDFFDTIHPEMGLRAWVTPMTGYFSWQNSVDHLPNIHRALQVGAQQGAEGVEPYGIFDKTFDRNYRCLAEFAWNQQTTGSLSTFREKYAALAFGEEQELAERAFASFDKVTATYGMRNWLSRLFYYEYAYAQDASSAFVRANYPQAILAAMAENPLNVAGSLRQAAAEAEKAATLFQAEVAGGDAALRRRHAIECERIAAMAAAFATLHATLADYEAVRREESDPARLGEIARSVEQVAARLDEVGGLVERSYEAYLVPQILREITLLRKFVVRLAGELNGIAAEVESGQMTGLPELECMRCEAVEWPDE